MPITGKQFELGIDSVMEGWMRRIHQFLTSHKEEAFTVVELAKELNGMPQKYQQLGELAVDEAFKVALDKLVEIGAVDSRIIRRERYYALGHVPLPL